MKGGYLEAAGHVLIIDNISLSQDFLSQVAQKLLSHLIRQDGVFPLVEGGNFYALNLPGFVPLRRENQADKGDSALV